MTRSRERYHLAQNIYSISWGVQAECFCVLTPLLVGVGVPVGCDALVHAVAHVQEDANIHPEERWTLLLDFSNAFNSVDRGSMFREVRDRIPSMAAWMESCYMAQPFLHLGEHTILSSCGVQEGDPLGPLGFALTLQPIIEKMKEEVPNTTKINAFPVCFTNRNHLKTCYLGFFIIMIPLYFLNHVKHNGS